MASAFYEWLNCCFAMSLALLLARALPPSLSGRGHRQTTKGHAGAHERLSFAEDSIAEDGMHRGYLAKEAYSFGKRGLVIWQKRPSYLAKEAY